MAKGDNISNPSSEQKARERDHPKPDMLDAVTSGELKLTEINAPFIARMLQKQLQSDKVNSDSVNTKDERNNLIAEQLKELGIDIKGQTEATKEKANNSQTQSIATPEKEKQEDPLKSINPANMQKINKEISRLRELKQEAPEYAAVFAEILEKDFAKKGKEGFGLSKVQINAIKSLHKDLFPKKEKKEVLSENEANKRTEDTSVNRNDIKQKAIKKYLEENSRRNKQ